MGVGVFAVTASLERGAWRVGTSYVYIYVCMEARRKLFVKTVARFAEPYIV